MNFTSMKIKPLVLALGVTALFASTSSFAVMQSVTTNKSISGIKPYIPYAHVKSSSGYLTVGSKLSFTLEGNGYVFHKDWGPAEETALAAAVVNNSAASGGTSGVNNAGGSMIFVDLDGDAQTVKDRFNSDKVLVEWYKTSNTDTVLTLPEKIALAASGTTPPTGWEYLTKDAGTPDYTLKSDDIDYQIAAVIIPITATGEPDRNAALVIDDVLKFAGQIVDPKDPDGGVDPDKELPPGPNPDITPPDEGNGVDPKAGADLRLVIHTDKDYHEAYLAYVADKSKPKPDLSMITPEEIFADSVDATQAAGVKLATNTTYYATILTTDVEGSTNPADYTTDVTNSYVSSLVWSYVDTNASNSYEIDNDGSLAFRTLRDSNLANGKGDIDGSGTNPVNDGSVKDRVKVGQDITTSANLTSPDGKGLNEQGFSIRFAVNDGE